MNLWSPDKIYYADLGWRNEDGSFLELARSNTVHTPPAWPRPIGPIEPVEPVEPIATPDPATMSESEQPPVREADPGPEPEPEPLPELDAVEPMRFEPVAIPVNFGEEIPGEPSQLEAPIPSTGYDLTQLSEDHFTPGISSDSEGSFGK